MKTLKLFAVAALAICFASCGGENSSKSEEETKKEPLTIESLGERAEEMAGTVKETFESTVSEEDVDKAVDAASKLIKAEAELLESAAEEELSKEDMEAVKDIANAYGDLAKSLE